MIFMYILDKRIIDAETPVVVTDENDRIKGLNQSFLRRFNINETDWLEKPVKALLKHSPRKVKQGAVFYCRLFEQAALVKVLQENGLTYYNIILCENDVSHHELVSFVNAIELKTYKRTKVNNSRYDFDDIIGESPAIKQVKELAAKIAMNNSTVLLTGESGTGKELFAQAIHSLSARKNQPFVAVNCIAIPDELFESELFGYEAGAFSGAKKEGKPGKIELAQHGTLFLDEISELSFQSQGKLLRVLQEKEVERLGGTTRRQVDIRVIAATNKDLKKLVEEGKFREDLFYRLYVFDLKIPPLRSRKEDIMLLVEHFIDEFNKKFAKDVVYIDSKLEEWLLTYDWPGNVRELKASIERGMNIVEGDTLMLEHLYLQPPKVEKEDRVLPFEKRRFSSLQEAVEYAEKRAIEQALEEADGDRSLAAQKLQIHVASLYRKLAKYKIK